MEILIVLLSLLLCLFVLLFLLKKTIKTHNQYKKTHSISNNTPTIKTDVTSTIDDNKYNVAIKKTNIGFILNPETPFELTVLNCSYSVAVEFRQLCEQGLYEGRDKLLSLFASYNIKIKEIEDYKNKYKPIYYKRIEELKSTSSEYKNAGQMDKADLLDEFKIEALNSIYELPDYDVEKIFINEDSTIDDELIYQYGFDCLNAYFAYFNKIGLVVSISKDNYYRGAFLQMTQKGLAITGKDIPIIDVLSSQSLKVLNSIANNPEKEYKRKNQAIEYILSKQELLDNLENHIRYRELFQLQALPDKYENIDVKAILRLWECYKVEIELLVQTFRNSIYRWKEQHEDSNLKDLYSNCFVRSTNSRCKCAKDREQKKYPIDTPPQVPCHIGCQCWINLE